jgi:hypothetical protein
MPTDVALTLSLPVILGSSSVMEFSELATEYSHSINRNGGYYDASWRLPLYPSIGIGEYQEMVRAEPDLFLSDDQRMGTWSVLRTWFESPYLMYHVEEKAAGAVTWEGVVWEMELTVGGLTKRVSMENVWNAVRVDYEDAAGSKHNTGWIEEAESIRLYGRKEMILHPKVVTATEATARGETFLARHAWPMPETVEIASTRAPGLFVQAVGYAATAQFQYINTDAADLATGNISDFVSRIIQYDCEFLRAGNIETNTLQRRRQFPDLMRGWDGIKALVGEGDASGAPWTAMVYNGRRLDYEQADAEPVLFWRGEPEGVTVGSGNINPWQVRPGVMRDLTSAITTAQPGGFLQQARDTLVEEVEMSDGREQPVFKPGGFDPLAILRARDQYLAWYERETSRES